MGKRIVFLMCILGMVSIFSFTLASCDTQDLISELVKDSEDSELAVDTDEQASAPPETQAETETETEIQTTAIDLAWVKYELVPHDGFKIHAEGVGGNGGNASVQIIESYEQLEQIHQSFTRYGLNFGYEAVFFEQNSLILIIFKYSGGEEFQSLDGLVIKDGTICPVITVVSPELVSCDYQYQIMTVEVQKTDVTAPAGKILIINLSNPDMGSSSHKDRFE